jgi:hypothetical protein
VVGATPRLGELRRGETIPWRVIAAQMAPRERHGSHRQDGARPGPVGALDRCSPARLRVRRLSRVQSIFRGTTEIMKEIIGRGL